MDLTSALVRFFSRLNGRAVALAFVLLLMILSLVISLGAMAVAPSVPG